MKRLLLSALAVSTMAAAALPASAAPWVSIDQRQANLDRRIDMGVRNGSLTRMEAGHLRAKFREIATLEARYRHTGGGLSMAERADLDRRMDKLSGRIVFQSHDDQRRY